MNKALITRTTGSSPFTIIMILYYCIRFCLNCPNAFAFRMYALYGVAAHADALRCKGVCQVANLKFSESVCLCVPLWKHDPYTWCTAFVHNTLVHRHRRRHTHTHTLPTNEGNSSFPIHMRNDAVCMVHMRHDKRVTCKQTVCVQTI